jgi:AcrR family transcriptional regulator
MRALLMFLLAFHSTPSRQSGQSQVTEKIRRIPRQARAASTIEAILGATLQLLEAHGPEKLTTNHIAARAGVSIGTLYQYFRDKDDLLATLAERRASAVRDNIADLVTNPQKTNDCRAIVQALIRSFEDLPRSRTVMFDALQRGSRERVLQRHHLAFLAAIDGKADLGGIELTPERAFILTHTPIRLLSAAAAEPELGLNPLALEDELVRLLEAYTAALVKAGHTEVEAVPT